MAVASAGPYARKRDSGLDKTPAIVNEGQTPLEEELKLQKFHGILGSAQKYQ